MRELLASLLLGIGAAHAQAPSCPQVTIGWALQWPGMSAGYDSNTQILYISINNAATAFSKVPIGAMQGLSRTNNPQGFYTSFIVPTYHAMLLTSTLNNCPLLFETGAPLWVD